MKSIDTLIPDIYKLFDGHDVSDKDAEAFGRDLANLIKSNLARYKPKSFPPSLYMSLIGKKDRQIYYEMNQYPKEKMEAYTKLKFLYGDVIEALALFLAKQSGHEVTEEQKRVEIDGVKGKKDCRIDGVTVDVKSASSYSFQKFQDGSLLENDPFGYIAQLSGYIQAEATGPEAGAFLAQDKQNGYLAVMKVPHNNQINVKERIKEIKAMLQSGKIPDRCYPDEPEGKSGNRKLCMNCSYCPYKFDCWKDANGGKGLRTFSYYSGPVFLTEVKREPKVKEIT